MLHPPWDDGLRFLTPPPLAACNLQLIILATLVQKRRHLSVKRRQLILVEGIPAAGQLGGASSGDRQGPQSPDGRPSTCRLFYVDPTSLEYKGQIPWSAQLHAELAPKGQFRIHTPARTYYLEDAAGDEATAELWVQTICNLQARKRAPASGAVPKLGKQMSMDSERRDWD
jgi:hypothetical protein